jgi:hypothetical protein
MNAATLAQVPFERYADYVVIHCVSQQQAIWNYLDFPWRP